MRDDALLRSTLRDILARPLLAATIDVAALASRAFQRYDVVANWQALSTISAIFNMYSGYRGKIFVRIVFNSSNVTQGASYWYWDYGEIRTFTGNQSSVVGQCYFPHDVSSPATSTTDTSLTYFTSRPGKYAMLGVNNTLEFDVGYPSNKSYLLTEIGASHEFGKLAVFNVVAAERVDSAAAPAATANVYVCLREAELYHYTPQSKKADLPEYNGIVSAPASILALAGRKLKNVPGIGKYADAAGEVAGSVAKLSSLFGFSRPVENNPLAVLGHPAFASGVGAIPGYRLALDPKKSLMSLQSQADGNEVDNLSIASIASLPSTISVISLTGADAVGTLKTSLSVSPAHAPVDTAGGYQIGFSNLSFASVFFKYWRGTIRFRVRTVSTQYVRGKFRVVWRPATEVAPAVAYGNFGTSYTAVYDIMPGAIHDIDVPYCAPTDYCPVRVPTGATISSFFGNGSLSFYVEETPVGMLSANCYLIVEIMAGDTFELAVPCANSLKFLKEPHFAYDAAVVATGDIPSPALASIISSFTAGNTTQVYETYVPQSKVASLTTAEYSVPTYIKFGTTETDVAPECVGERILSLRPLLKKLTYYKKIITPPTAGAASACISALLPLPQCPGIYDSPAGVRYNLDTNMTPFTLLSRAFLGYRGSTVYALTGDAVFAATNGKSRRAVVTNVDVPPGSNSYVPITDGTAPRSQTTGEINLDHITTSLAEEFNLDGPEPKIVDIPYHSARPFEYVNDPALASGSTFGLGLTSITGRAAAMIVYNVSDQKPTTRLHIAIGEDFELIRYLGPPLMTVFKPNF